MILLINTVTHEQRRLSVRELFDMLADESTARTMSEDPRDPSKLGAVVYYITPKA